MNVLDKVYSFDMFSRDILTYVVLSVECGEPKRIICIAPYVMDNSIKAEERAPLFTSKLELLQHYKAYYEAELEQAQNTYGVILADICRKLKKENSNDNP